MNKIKSQLKIWNLDAHALRGKNFFKNILDYRAKILPRQKHRIRPARDFQCVLCGGRKGTPYLSWQAGYQLFSCARCAVVSANISIDANHIEKVYDNEDYYQKIKGAILKQYAYRKRTFGIERYRYIIERLKLKPKKTRVLDVGCGAGYFLSALKDLGIEGRGLEVSPAQVRYCRESGLDVAGSDLIDEPDNHYDVITMFDVLEHLTEPIATIKTACRKLKPGGYLIAYTPNIHSLAYELMGGKQNTLLPFEHFCFFNKPSFQYLAKKTGFTIHTLEVYGLDVMDYLLMKEYEDDIDYTVKLKDFMNVLQACVDKLEFGNHFRLTLKKKK